MRPLITNKQFITLFVCVAVTVAGCSVQTVPVKPPVTMPAGFSQSGSAQVSQKWWLDFNDPQLDALIDRALSDNFSLKTSWDRLNQAKAAHVKSQSGFFPTINGAVDVSEKSVTSDGRTTTGDDLAIGLTAAYEIDLWGRIRSTAEAARLDMVATQADLDAAAMTLAVQVATTWYTLVAQHNEITLLSDQIEANEKGLAIIETRLRAGQVPLADKLQQQQLVALKKGEQANLIAEQKHSEHALALLLGQVPGSISLNEVPEQLIELPPLPDTGIPAQTILSRPDVHRALLAVEAADQRVAAAIADRFPTLRLTGTFQTSGTFRETLLSNYLASIAAGLVGPILDGGKRTAEVERTRAVASERLNAYGQAVLDAIGEVEDALVREKQHYVYLDSVQEQLELSKQTVEQVQLRYLKGVEKYERVLTALISMQSLEQKMLKAKQALLVNRIQLCRALGSGWQYSVQPH